jgi:ribosomal peptide maturation radical SAM protein 1
MKRVLLINMPFATAVFPSLALGLFKSRFELEGLPCDVAYFNVLFAQMVGWENFSMVAAMNGLFAGEQMFARVLFGDSIPSDAQYLNDVVAGFSQDMVGRVQQMKSQVTPFLEHCLNKIPWQSYDIIGFSSLFEQNIPSLALAYFIKRYFPDKTIVFGGANCEEILGLTLHRCFPFIDYVCSGEADETFPELVRRVRTGQPVNDLPGLVYRSQGESVFTGDPRSVEDLDNVPFPNYDDYYQYISQSSLPGWMSTCLLMETSRGCWWGEKARCSFCSLNGKHLTYRSKSPARTLAEINYLLQRYHAYNVSIVRFVDNVLNLHYFDDLFPQLALLGLDSQFFLEVRATLEKTQVKALAQAGITEIQAGIENLSTHTLKLMRKGTTALDNIQLLKWCKQYGINADWNIIFGFPGEKADDIHECVKMFEILTHLSPPTGYGPFRLDRFSYNFENASTLGITNVRPLSIYHYLYPLDDSVLKDMVYYFDYELANKVHDEELFGKLANQYCAWKGRQDQLSGRRVGERLVITDSRPVAPAAQVTLEGVRMNIYEYCDQKRAVKQIQEWLADNYRVNMPHDKICAILADFVEKKLMVQDGTWFLSLAVLDYLS